MCCARQTISEHKMRLQLASLPFAGIPAVLSAATPTYVSSNNQYVDLDQQCLQRSRMHTCVPVSDTNVLAHNNES